MRWVMSIDTILHALTEVCSHCTIAIAIVGGSVPRMRCAFPNLAQFLRRQFASDDGRSFSCRFTI